MLRTFLIWALSALILSPLDPQSAVAQSVPAEGFIYGTLTLQNGTQHTGFLRWEDEEAFWDDLFHSRENPLPWTEFADLKALHREKEKRYFETHGMVDRLKYALHNRNPDDNISRLFVARFGDIEVITIDEDENITVTLNDGSNHQVAGYSNDVSTDILVYSNSADEASFDWDDLAEIRFAQAPATATPYAQRLYGQVSTSRGDFEGFIQWDKSECTSIDVLDSDQEDLAMGEIRALTRKPGGEVIADLVDGRQLSLSGSNDVNSGNRGVVVETAHLGRVTIAWERFRQVDFLLEKGSGPGRKSYTDNAGLSGHVIAENGQQYSGPLVYDLNAASQHDIFNGSREGLDYDIPFALIKAITPLPDDACQVGFHGGQVLELSEDKDTGANSTGVLIFDSEMTEAHRVPWSKITEVRFAP